MNALLGGPYLPMGAVPMTSVVTTVQYGPVARALVRSRVSSLPVEVPVTEVARFVAQASADRTRMQVASVEVEIPAEMLVRDELEPAPPVVFDDRIYRTSGMQLMELVRDGAPPARTLMLVGHDPAIPDLAIALAGAGAKGDAESSGPLRRMASKFPTAAVAILQGTPTWDQLWPGSMRLTWFVTPRDLRAAHRCS
jgi:phosphohistidine phosphatase SixA